MRTDYKTLGNYIQLVDTRNRDLTITNLLGVSIEKKFIPSIANIVGTDLSSYKVVRTGQFAYGPVTSRNGEKISIAYLDGEDCIISSSYFVFEVTNKAVLDPEYLMLWFSRPEFDRYARYKSHGSVREIFDWNELCMVELPVPEIEEQKKIVKAYKTITDRIALKKQINDNLEATTQAIFEDCFADYYTETLPLPSGWKKATFADVCQIKGGKRLPAECEFSSSATTHPYIRIRDMYQGKYLELTEDFEYVEEDVFSYIKNYIVSSGDVIIAIVGITSGEISIIGETLDRANLTENCVKLTKFRGVTAEYLYCYWQYLRKNGGIDPLLVGAAQPKLPMYNIQVVSVIIPDESALSDFQKRASNLSKEILNNLQEIKLLKEMQTLLVANISSR